MARDAARPPLPVHHLRVGLGVEASRRGLFCVDHLSLVPQVYRERLEQLRKAWRPQGLSRAPQGGLPPPSPWEAAAHRWLFPEAQAGVPQHPYTRWYAAACSCAAWILARLWEGAFPLPGAAPQHVTAGTCPCPLCVHARALAVKAVERRC